MLFNSYGFIFLFLPLVLLGFFLLARSSHIFAAGWLAAASLFFYGYWNPAYVLLLLGSIICNYILGLWIAKNQESGIRNQRSGVQRKPPPLQGEGWGGDGGKAQGNRSTHPHPNLPLEGEGMAYCPASCFSRLTEWLEYLKSVNSKWLLILAITANLLLLAYYKYANFFITNVNSVAGTQWDFDNIILPLGISFFTFTQIAFLVDTYQGKVKEYNFIHYTLFVTYFPHLIAGPVLHHKEMMPQFAQASTYRFNYQNMAVGLTIFFIGLFKKVIIDDGIAVYVGPVFNAPEAGIHLTFIEAWGGALCYTLQLYFDFSGYSDMAIGLSRMFGIILPLNFHSPFKAVNIIDFWQRWHMTLTRYIKEYLYIPITLALTRIGFGKPALVEVLYSLVIPTIAIFLILGLWHGASWTYVIFGGMHGVMLVINNLWRMRNFWKLDKKKPHSLIRRALGWVLTFAGVNLAFVMFRSDSIATAASFYKSMLGAYGLVIPDAWLPKWGAFGQWLTEHGATFGPHNGLIGSGAINWIWILMLVVLLAPNTQQIMQNFKPALGVPAPSPTRLKWRPSLNAAILVWLLGFIAVINLNKESAFLYFQF